MLLIILISVLVIGILIAKTKLKQQPKTFEPGLDYSHEELAPESTPEPSIVEAISVPTVEKKIKKKSSSKNTTKNSSLAKMEAKKTPIKKKSTKK